MSKGLNSFTPHQHRIRAYDLKPSGNTVRPRCYVACGVPLQMTERTPLTLALATHNAKPKVTPAAKFVSL